MDASYSSQLRNDLWSTVLSSVTSAGIVNIPVLAASLRNRYEAENVAMEDVERLVLEVANRLGVAIEFDARAA
ncbi:hypothetical protein GA830_06645 [Mesorhizobium sp. NBSH29]|uniref:hypothetical protein n=1 Tax=Mesorhizobium sp. NBSH29 TaxID=2654249 RepID=UPI0018965D65|nr:hypothetical protein [Mesorhizobium sp. NBSH29]QPC86448.1 hypothetical protein GA830_06645 [Mesorhizobium sp. NBSH29]